MQFALNLDMRDMKQRWMSRSWEEIKAERKKMRKGKKAVRQEVGEDVQQGLLSIPTA